MSTELMEAAQTLIDTLEAENTALAALDLPRSIALLADKERAMAGFAAVQGAPASREAVRRMAQQLQAVTAENKRLLERAIATQRRVIGVIARAATPPPAPTGYGSVRGRRPTAFALLAKA